MSLVESPAAERDLAVAGARPPPGRPVSVWASTAAAAVLHAAVLFAGSRAEAGPPEEAQREALDRLRRYLSASEARESPRDTVSSESQGRALNRLAEGADGAGAGGDDAPGDGTEKKASAGHLASATAGAGSGKDGKGAGALPPYEVRYGRLPAEVIQRVVRQNFGRFRLCLEESRNAWWGLWARVTVRFVIGRTGAVTSATVTESTVWDREVGACVARAFRGLQFPRPEGGVVVVSYPISFSPGG